MMNLIKGMDIEMLKKQLKTKGYKLTPQRRAVFSALIENEGKHLTIEEIYEAVKGECPEIGLATVYRTLLILEDVNIVFKMTIDDGKMRYELSHSEEDHHHHHLICLKCGKVMEVEEDLLENLEKDIESKYKFKITNHELKFFGYCSSCKDKL